MLYYTLLQKIQIYIVDWVKVQFIAPRPKYDSYYWMANFKVIYGIEIKVI